MRLPRVFKQTGLLILAMIFLMVGASAAFIILGSKVTKVVTDYRQPPPRHVDPHVSYAYQINFSKLRLKPLQNDQVKPYLTGLSQPRAIGFGGDELYLAVLGDASLKKAYLTGEIATVTDELGEATSLVVESQDVVLPIPTENRVVKVNRQSGQVTTVASGLQQPTGIAPARSGGYYVTNTATGTLVKIGSDGQVSVVASDLKQPMGVVVDNDNIIRVAQAGDSENSVVQIQDNGRRSTVVHGLVGARALYYDTLKNLVISHTVDGHSALSIFFSNGEMARVLDTSLTEPIVSVASDNKYLYFTAQKPDEAGVYRVALP